MAVVLVIGDAGGATVGCERSERPATDRPSTLTPHRSSGDDAFCLVSSCVWARVGEQEEDRVLK